VHGSFSIFVPIGTHAAMSRPAPSSANDAHPFPPLHVEASKGLHTGEQPRLPLVSWPQTLLGPQSASVVH
jgi:hypothetical protein